MSAADASEKRVISTIGLLVDEFRANAAARAAAGGAEMAARLLVVELEETGADPQLIEAAREAVEWLRRPAELVALMLAIAAVEEVVERRAES